MNYPHANFVLPGLVANNSAQLGLAVAMASAYSGQFNSRLLEHIFYGPWTIILTSLISDLKPSISVAPPTL